MKSGVTCLRELSFQRSSALISTFQPSTVIPPLSLHRVILVTCGIPRFRQPTTSWSSKSWSCLRRNFPRGRIDCSLGLEWVLVNKQCEEGKRMGGLLVVFLLGVMVLLIVYCSPIFCS